ncbi:choline transporter-like protein 1 isoform X2 [Amphiura filiformis]|uniref:choline transporter-like protein 1 isoform X2 n=1 Tax=Amphiura filiformis TaxID=82378 RepID=UPI003B219505
MACGPCMGAAGDEPDGGKLQPIAKRSCTDILCCFLFIVFWVGMLLIAAYSILFGNVFRIIYGYDSFGNICSMENEPIEGVELSGMDMTNKSRVFFMDIRDPVRSMEICVSQCPDEMLNTNEEVKDFATETGSRLCRYDIDTSEYPTADQGLDGPCPEVVYESKNIINRCVPVQLEEFVREFIDNVIEALNSAELISKALADVYMARWAILAMCVIALVLAFLMVFLIHIVAQIVVWLIYIISVVGSIAGTVALWITWKMKKDMFEQLPELEQLDAASRNVQAFLIYSILATVFTVILCLVILVMRKRIAFTVELYHQAGKALSAMPLLLIQPVWTFLILAVFFIYVAAVFVFISATGHPTVMNDTGYVTYDPPSPVRHFWWYHAVGFIWTAEFILACHQFVIAASVADWYFTREKKKYSSPILKAIGRLTSYHLGSMVFGAFIILLVKIPRAILLYIQYKLKDSANEVAKCVLKCLSCCLYCLEKFLKYINENAYIIIAIEGGGFCNSARKALIILLSNSLRVAAINCVGDFVLFLGKLTVVALTAVSGLLIMGFQDDPRLIFYAIPVGIGSIFAYIFASCFLSVYEMAVDTLLLCFCEDTRINDGSAEKPYFMDKSLMEFVSKSSKKMNKKKKKSDKEDETDADPAAVRLHESPEKSSPTGDGPRDEVDAPLDPAKEAKEA